VRTARLFMAEAAAIKAKHANFQAEYAETKVNPDEKTEAKTDENFPDLDRTLQTFVSDCVRSMLSKLYADISKFEYELKEKPKERNSQKISNREILKTWIRTLYLDEAGSIYIVGPMGERPIHCCVFAVAKYRARQGEASQMEKYIADGILEGIKEYEKNENQGNTSRLYEEYGKDYCAAVGCFLWEYSRETGKSPLDLKRLRPSTDLDSASVKVEDLWQFLPYICQVIMWLRNHRKCNTTRLGMYEGETPHFALIACCHEDAVKWFISVEEKEIKKNSLQEIKKLSLHKRCGLLLKGRFIIDSILSSKGSKDLCLIEVLICHC
jgi:hypothetical protein